MSHITPLKRRSGGYDLEVIYRMCSDKGWQIKEANTFKAYQSGQSCDFAIKIPGVAYEIGVSRGTDGHEMHFDTWYRGGLAPIIGEKGTQLEDEYNIAKTKMTAENFGHSWEECLSEAGERQVVVFLHEEY